MTTDQKARYIRMHPPYYMSDRESMIMTLLRYGGLTRKQNTTLNRIYKRAWEETENGRKLNAPVLPAGGNQCGV